MNRFWNQRSEQSQDRAVADAIVDGVFVGDGVCQLRAAGRLRQPRRPTAQNAGWTVDADRGGDAGWNRRGSLLPVATADDGSLSALQYGACLGRALLSAVSVPTGSGLRAVFPRGADYGCVLHTVRT
jgi:hypothetical protein